MVETSATSAEYKVVLVPETILQIAFETITDQFMNGFMFPLVYVPTVCSAAQ